MTLVIAVNLNLRVCSQSTCSLEQSPCTVYICIMYKATKVAWCCVMLNGLGRTLHNCQYSCLHVYEEAPCRYWWHHTVPTVLASSKGIACLHAACCATRVVHVHFCTSHVTCALHVLLMCFECVLHMVGVWHTSTWLYVCTPHFTCISRAFVSHTFSFALKTTCTSHPFA